VQHKLSITLVRANPYFPASAAGAICRLGWLPAPPLLTAASRFA
jgi:hypothetical protein